MKFRVNKKLWLIIVVMLFAPSVLSDTFSRFTVLGSDFSVRYNGEFSNAEKKKLFQWLTQAAEAVTTLYNRFPEDKVQVELVRSSSSEPVPWGQVQRRSIPKVTFHINPKYSLQDFQDDWVAVHEFSHLLLPYAGEEDHWMSEGLASYYQNVLRARHGMISEKSAWKKLIQGFQRGEADNFYRHLTLAEVSLEMRRTRSYMRVYWSGAAYFLISDIEIRKVSKGKLSLDKVLNEFNRCCLRISRYWEGRQIAKKMDEIAKVDVFYPAYVRFKQSYNIPNTKPELDSLGVSMERGKVTFNSKAVSNRMRQAIMLSGKASTY